jgi:4-amino-4-deoxy-L-arabinose transferase-like glycosyltransferase
MKRARSENFRRFDWTSPWLIAGAALVLRAAFSAAWHTYLISAGNDHFVFAWERGRIARSLAMGEGFANPFGGSSGPTAWSGPLFPALLAVIFKAFGIYTKSSAVIVIALQAIASAATCAALQRLGTRVFSPRSGVCAAWAWAFFPPAFEYSLVPISEAPFTAFFLILLLLFVLRLEEEAPLREWAVFGLFAGLLVLFAPETLLVLIGLAAWVYARQRRRGMPSTRWVAVAGLLFLVVLTPWTVRNYRMFGKFIPLRSNAGAELYVGNQEGSEGLSAKYLHPATNLYERESYRRMGEIAYVADRQEKAIRFITSHPGVFLELTATRFLFWWAGWWTAAVESLLQGHLALPYRFVFYLLVSLLAYAGMRLCMAQKNRAWMPFLIVLAIYPLPYYIVHVNNRYRHPIEPLLVLLGCYALCSLIGARTLPRASGEAGVNAR